MTVNAFDYIIVGAGSAGCVLAEKLSADTRNRILLIEQGAKEDWMVRMPKGFGKLLSDPKRTYFIPTEHKGKNGVGSEIWFRGRMLGGSSGVNGMVWTRGQQADYDRLAELAGPQWSWSEMLPHLRGLEDHAMGESDTRGAGGPIAIKTHPCPSKLTNAFVAAGVELGLPLKEDQNQLSQEGIGYLQWNIDPRGRRVSAARGFLRRATKRRNLTIETGIRADRLIVTDGRAVAVEGMRKDHPVRFEARREIILSAGAVGSPRLLQQSGIGPAETLKSAGIPVLLDSPDIGHHLREHRLLLQHFRLRNAGDSDNRAFGGINLLHNVLRYTLFGTGPMALGSSEAAAFVRVLPESVRPDAQIMFAPYSLDLIDNLQFESEPGMQLFAMALRPKSEGSALITSPDPREPLRITPNYLSDATDRRTLIAAVRYIRKLIAQPALVAFLTGETEITGKAQTDDELLALFDRFGQCGHHSVGTVRMGRDNSPLDGRLNVRGIARLRVVDCSVFPEMIAGNTNAPTMAMASRAAQLILEDARA